jgi:hypothetical protein
MMGHGAQDGQVATVLEAWQTSLLLHWAESLTELANVSIWRQVPAGMGRAIDIQYVSTIGVKLASVYVRQVHSSN